MVVHVPYFPPIPEVKKAQLQLGSRPRTTGEEYVIDVSDAPEIIELGRDNAFYWDSTMGYEVYGDFPTASVEHNRFVPQSAPEFEPTPNQIGYRPWIMETKLDEAFGHPMSMAGSNAGHPRIINLEHSRIVENSPSNWPPRAHHFQRVVFTTRTMSAPVVYQAGSTARYVRINLENSRIAENPPSNWSPEIHHFQSGDETKLVVTPSINEMETEPASAGTKIQPQNPDLKTELSIALCLTSISAGAIIGAFTWPPEYNNKDLLHKVLFEVCIWCFYISFISGIAMFVLFIYSRRRKSSAKISKAIMCISVGSIALGMAAAVSIALPTTLLSGVLAFTLALMVVPFIVILRFGNH